MAVWLLRVSFSPLGSRVQHPPGVGTLSRAVVGRSASAGARQLAAWKPGVMAGTFRCNGSAVGVDARMQYGGM